VDTGASDHISFQINIPTNKRKLTSPIYVRMPYGSVKIVKIIGDVHLGKHFILRDVLYPPEFRNNLLSVSKLLDTSNLTAWFTRHGFVFQDHPTERNLAAGPKEARLYMLGTPCREALSSPQNIDIVPYLMHSNTFDSKGLNAKDLAILHARMGHMSLLKRTHLDDISVSTKASDDFICDTCQLAKFHRLPFPLSKSIAPKPFDLVHVDLWGPYTTADTSGA